MRQLRWLVYFCLLLIVSIVFAQPDSMPSIPNGQTASCDNGLSARIPAGWTAEFTSLAPLTTLTFTSNPLLWDVKEPSQRLALAEEYALTGWVVGTLFIASGSTTDFLPTASNDLHAMAETWTVILTQNFTELAQVPEANLPLWEEGIPNPLEREAPPSIVGEENLQPLFASTDEPAAVPPFAFGTPSQGAYVALAMQSDNLASGYIPLTYSGSIQRLIVGVVASHAYGFAFIDVSSESYETMLRNVLALLQSLVISETFTPDASGARCTVAAAVNFDPIGRYGDQEGESAYIFNDRYIIVMDAPDSGELIDVVTGEPIVFHEQPNIQPFKILISADYTHLADDVAVYSMETGERVAMLPRSETFYDVSIPLSLALDPADFTRAAVVSNPNTGEISIVDLVTGSVEQLPFYQEFVPALVYSHDGRYLVADNFVGVYDFENPAAGWRTDFNLGFDVYGSNVKFAGEALYFNDISGFLAVMSLQNGWIHSAREGAVLASSDRVLVYVAREDAEGDTVYAIDTMTGERIVTLDAGQILPLQNTGEPSSIAALDSEVKRLALALPGTLTVINLEDGTPLFEIERDDSTSIMDISYDAALIAIGDANGVITLIDAETGESVGTLNARESLRQIVFAADGGHLMAHTASFIVLVWRLEVSLAHSR